MMGAKLVVEIPDVVSDLAADPEAIAQNAARLQEKIRNQRLIDDEDVYDMSKEELRNEVIKLRAGIRAHRDAEGHNLCWYVPELWGLLPEKVTPKPAVPPTSS